MKLLKSAILFDMDGVTINTEPLYTKAEIKLFKEYGVIIPVDDWHLFRGSSEDNFFDLSMERYNIKEDRDIFINKGRQYVRDEFNMGIPFMSGFKKLHKRISSSYLMGLVTAAPERSLNWIVKKNSLDKYFNHMLSGETAKKNKPHPDPYLAMMKTLEIDPLNAVIIEDSVDGIQSGLSSGAHVIAKRGSVPNEKIKNAHLIIDHLDEISIELLEDILQQNI